MKSGVVSEADVRILTNPIESALWAMAFDGVHHRLNYAAIILPEILYVQ